MVTMLQCHNIVPHIGAISVHLVHIQHGVDLRCFTDEWQVLNSRTLVAWILPTTESCSIYGNFDVSCIMTSPLESLGGLPFYEKLLNQSSKTSLAHPLWCWDLAQE